MNLSHLEHTKKQSPGPLEEFSLRDGPIIDHLLLLPVTTRSDGFGYPLILSLPKASPLRALSGLSVTFNEIHQGASWLDLLHLPCLISDGRPLEEAKEVSVNSLGSLRPPFLCP